MPILLLVMLLTFSIGIVNLGLAAAYGTQLVLFSWLFGQWFLVLIPLHIAAGSFGLHLRHQSDSDCSHATKRWQFGIGQLMAYTTLVAIAFGVSRFFIPLTPGKQDLGQLSLFGFSAGIATVMCVVLLMAMLLPRFALAFSLLALVLIALITLWEGSLMQRSKISNATIMEVIWLHLLSMACILVLGGVARMSGYRLRAGTVPINQNNSAAAER